MEYENILFQSSLLYSADSDPRTVGYFDRIFHWNINFHGSLTIPVPPMKNFLPVLMQSMTSALSVRTIMNYQ